MIANLENVLIERTHDLLDKRSIDIDKWLQKVLQTGRCGGYDHVGHVVTPHFIQTLRNIAQPFLYKTIGLVRVCAIASKIEMLLDAHQLRYIALRCIDLKLDAIIVSLISDAIGLLFTCTTNRIQTEKVRVNIRTR